MTFHRTDFGSLLRCALRLTRTCIFIGIVAGALPGCGTGLTSTGASRQQQSTDNSTIIDADYPNDDGDNDTFATASPLQLTTNDQQINGTIGHPDDVDVYDLGPVDAGMRVVAHLDPDRDLNGAIALFDATGTCLLVNDHRNVYLGTAQPFVDVPIRTNQDHCYIAVTTTPEYESLGSYSMITYGEWENHDPPERPETVILDFAGADNVSLGSRPAVNVPPFDAANIDSSYAGLTDEIVERVVAMVREDFTGFNVVILSTSEGYQPDSTMTRVYFGTYDAALLGVAEGVDEYNELGPQKAFVFTDTFSHFMALRPSVDEIAQALANVASHETGHLLGLVHTHDPDSLMDITASLNRLISDQQFKRAPLHEEVFPIGYQDAVQQLLDTTGGDLDTVLAAQARKLEETHAKGVDYSGPPAREAIQFGTCLRESHRD